jgi:hypothetical protein
MMPCRLDDLNGWLEEEAGTISEDAFRTAIIVVNARLDCFVNWPQRPELLWYGCDRKREEGKRHRYHSFPDVLKPLVRQHKFTDRRSNGPAKLAYLVAGGTRPIRASGHGWNIHHCMMANSHIRVARVHRYGPSWIYGTLRKALACCGASRG